MYNEPISQAEFDVLISATVIFDIGRMCLVSVMFKMGDKI